MKNKKKIIKLIVIALVLYIISGFTFGGNNALEMNSYTIHSDRLPDAFDGFRIVHISDLHNTEMGANNEKLLEMIREAQPDIIAITGDIIDAYKTDMQIALHFAEKAAEIAPCYYVTGNHEAWTDEYSEFRESLITLGVTVLSDEQLYIERSGEKISIIGIEDPAFGENYDSSVSDMADAKLKDFDYTEKVFTLLLSHRPELFDVYVENDIDLVLSGHTHAGQFRFPFVGGLVAPDQGLFPEYDAGLYTQENTDMLVSRGIGNSIIPLRFYNRPEVILIELKAE